VKIRNFSEYLIKRFCDMSDIDFGSIKSADNKFSRANRL